MQRRSYGYHIANHPDFVAPRRIADVAVQFRVGLLPKRDFGPDSNCPDHIVGDGQALNDIAALVLGFLTFKRRMTFFMNRFYIALTVALALAQGGCAFMGGAATGALATGAGYEINAKRQMDKLEDDYKNERISRQEYEKRKAQIEKGSIIY